MANLRLKYAPNSLDDVVFPSSDAKQVIMDMVELKTLNHVILYGPCGTGKTSVAELIPEAVLGYKLGMDCIEFDADFESGIENIRELKHFVERICFGDKDVKFVIIDEVDGLSAKAQKALRGVLNTADETNTYFIMTTNYIESIESGIRSRCTCIEFDNFDPKLWLPRAKDICKQEGIVVHNENDLLEVIDCYGADIRKFMRKLEEVMRKADASVV